MKKVSIIVPIYNAEKYLTKSIKSLKDQTLKDIEIILVNDGSTDKSLEICNCMCKNDSRIKIINKPNGGVSSARNAGLDIAEGEYVGIVDPDDWIEKDMYENLYNQAIDSYSNICMCNYSVDSKENTYDVLLNISENTLEGHEIIDKIIANIIHGTTLNNTDIIMGSVWRLLIKREIVNLNNVRFRTELPFMEDWVFAIECFIKSDKVSINKSVYYHYVNNTNSAGKCYRKNLWEIQKKVFMIIKNLLIENNLITLLKERLELRYLLMANMSLINESSSKNSKRLNEKIRYINDICSDYELNKILNKINLKDCNIKKKLVITAMKRKFATCIYIYYALLK